MMTKNKNNDNEDRDKKPSILITKGALHNILEICSLAELPDGKTVDITPTIKQNIIQKYEEFGNKGFRILGVAYRNIVIGKLLPFFKIKTKLIIRMRLHPLLMISRSLLTIIIILFSHHI
jgi:magnesium-transporting ATPase (P-type)